ncbi:hypothetical protein CSB11_01780 [Candidatus Campbellbacteria bacterium]|nr:MAG: hypothetical protein CSB11_01780 [Candidatus Campbellbacteria bacterium]
MDMKKFYVKKSSCPQEQLFWNRENGLHLEVEEYFHKKGYFIPSFLKTENPNGRLNAFSVRHIATYRNEDKAFLNLATTMFGLNPIWLEYQQDKYTQHSKPKTSNLILNTGGERKLKIACPAKNDGKKLNQIQTNFGKSLVDFHHTLWSSLPHSGIRKKFDFSDFLKQFGSAEDYYFYDLALSVAHGVLFKDFHGEHKLSSKGSKEFTRKIVEPAFEKVVKTFGVSPVVVQFSYHQGYEIYPNLKIPKCLQ